MRSDDAGGTWREISNLPCDFGFPVEVHAHEPETGIFPTHGYDAGALGDRRPNRSPTHRGWRNGSALESL